MTLPSEVASESQAFLAIDGLTYACKADRLIGRPEETFRNKEIIQYRRQGYDKAWVDCWIEGYDSNRYLDWGTAEGHAEKAAHVYNDVCGDDPEFPF